MAEPLLRVHDLRTYFYTESGVARSVDGVSFEIGSGETVGLVGESGCGKSVTALSLLRLIRPPGRIEAGSEIAFDGKNLTTIDEKSMRAVRGARISMVFQEPMTALNPVFTVGDQIAEVVRIHGAGSKREAWDRAVKMLETVGIPAPAQRANEYPHQLSGGMRQRVVIAMALVMNPALVIADEPTTALDVTIQAQILDLLREMKAAFNLSLLLITHDLGVVAETADRVAVMYAGRIVETGPVRAIFRNPAHPYTRGLLASIPGGAAGARLRAIEGTVPLLGALPTGCAFHPRCPDCFDPCTIEPPRDYPAGSDQTAKCYLHDPTLRPNPQSSAIRNPQSSIRNDNASR